MLCPKCNRMSDADAMFCNECGAELTAETGVSHAKGRRVYLYALFLVPVILIAMAIGYYKYFLPHGVAAVVNGEEITLAELEAAVVFYGGDSQPADSRFRYQVLNQLISERLVLQEANRAGMSISREEAEAALEESRSSSGLNEDAFAQRATAVYGSKQAFDKAFMRNLLINKFMTEKVLPPGAAPEKAEQAATSWMRELSGRASVRVTLAEQVSGAGCRCCNNSGSAWASEKDGKQAPNKGISSGQTNAEKASAAAVAYWREKHGSADVTANVKDFGCHFEVDIIKDNKKIGSLRYQGGMISEL